MSVAGCQPPAGTAPAPTATGTSAAAPAGVPAGLVRIPYGQLHGWGGRRRLAEVDGGAITRIRVTATGPGVARPVVASAAFAPDSGALPAIDAPGEVAITVPTGENRVFILEGLDADGRVVAVMRTLGAVTGGSQRLTINADTDAAARVLASLLAGPQAGDAIDAAGIRGTLATADLTGPLRTYVNNLTGYDSAANTYSGNVPPMTLRDRALADRLRSEGAAFLDGTVPAELQDVAGGEVAIAVVDGGSAVSGARVTLYDPRTTPDAADGAGGVSFTNVPPGTWTVVAEAGDRTVAARVTIRDQEAAATVTLDLDQPETYALDPLPLPAGDPPGTPGALPWVDTLAGGDADRTRLALLGDAAGTAVGAVAIDDAGATYLLSHGKLLRARGADQV